MISLRGMTWNHDRGLQPMLATASRFHQEHPDIEIRWGVRSLRDFGDAPVESLAEQFDLAVLDHPFMGDLAHAGCFLALDQHIGVEPMAHFAADTLGHSHVSYTFAGHQWALAIDAACQVASYREDLLAREEVAPPATWTETVTLARRRRGLVSLALTPLDTLMSFFSLCATAGEPCFAQPGSVVSQTAGRYALEMLRELRAHAAPRASTENPIALYERMSSTDETAYCPLAFGYSNYARDGYRACRLAFTVPPSANARRSSGTLGGAGLAISAHCRHPDEALAYATWVAGAECQSNLYVEAGGQPASRNAWESAHANALSHDYFRATQPALETAWLRPRSAGYVPFQNAAGEVIARYMDGHLTPSETLLRFDALWRQSESAGSCGG